MQTVTRGFGAMTIQSLASEQQKPYSYTKIPKSFYYTLGGRAKSIRLLLHVLTNRLFMSTGNESESKIICMQMKFHMQVPSRMEDGGEREGLFAFCKVWVLHQLYLGTQCLTASIKSGLCQQFSLETERERGEERGRGRLMLHDSHIQSASLNLKRSRDFPSN